MPNIEQQPFKPPIPHGARQSSTLQSLEIISPIRDRLQRIERVTTLYNRIRSDKTPILDNLERISNQDNYGLPAVADLIVGMAEALQKDKKVAVMVKGPATSGKTSTILECITAVTEGMPEFLGREPRVGVIQSEKVYDWAKDNGLIDPTHQHGHYTHKEYDIGSLKIEDAVVQSFQKDEYDIVFIDTPDTTGVQFEVGGRNTTFGKNRGTSVGRNLTKKQQQNDNFEFFVMALIPGIDQARRSLTLRKQLDRLSDDGKIAELLERNDIIIEGPLTDLPGASAGGTVAINREIDEVVVTLLNLGIISADVDSKLIPTPTALFSKPDLRDKLLGSSLYPAILQDDFHLPSNRAFIAMNEALPRGRKRVVSTEVLKTYNILQNYTG
jgi:hypothetical protein